MTTNYVVVPMALLSIGTYELAVYCSLLSYATGSPPQASATDLQLSARTRISPSRTKAALVALRDAGWITWDQQARADGSQTSHRYTIHGTPEARP